MKFYPALFSSESIAVQQQLSIKWARVDQFWNVDGVAMAYCTIFDTYINLDADKVVDKLITKKTKVVFCNWSRSVQTGCK